MSAHDEAELGLLIEEANTLLADDLQGELDLGLQGTQREVALVAPPSQPALFGTTTVPAGRRVAAPTVRRTDGAAHLLPGAFRCPGGRVRRARVRCRGR